MTQGDDPLHYCTRTPPRGIDDTQQDGQPTPSPRDDGADANHNNAAQAATRQNKTGPLTHCPTDTLSTGDNGILGHTPSQNLGGRSSMNGVSLNYNTVSVDSKGLPSRGPHTVIVSNTYCALSKTDTAPCPPTASDRGASPSTECSDHGSSTPGAPRAPAKDGGQNLTGAHQHVKGWPYPAPNMDHDAACIYDAALLARSTGALPPRVDHTTSLKTAQWEAETTAHQYDTMVIHGIKHGFSMQYTGPPILRPTDKYNHHSAGAFADHVNEYVRREIQEGALSGPYKDPPFTPWFVSSPLMTREKSSGDGRRIIVDLSFPEGGINKHIIPHRFNGREAIHNLPTISAAVSTIAHMCPGRCTWPWSTSPGLTASSQWIQLTGPCWEYTGTARGPSTGASPSAVAHHPLLCSLLRIS